MRDKGIELEVVEYLKTPPDEATLSEIIDSLGIEPHALIRKKEKAYAELDLEAIKDNRQELISKMVANPVLIERPIVVKGNEARIGRPPESVLELL